MLFGGVLCRIFIAYSVVNYLNKNFNELITSGERAGFTAIDKRNFVVSDRRGLLLFLVLIIGCVI